MAKTYVVSKRIINPKDGSTIYSPGQYVSKTEAQSHPNNVKLVQTKFAVSEHSFEVDPVVEAQKETKQKESGKGKK